MSGWLVGGPLGDARPSRNLSAIETILQVEDALLIARSTVSGDGGLAPAVFSAPSSCLSCPPTWPGMVRRANPPENPNDRMFYCGPLEGASGLVKLSTYINAKMSPRTGLISEDSRGLGRRSERRNHRRSKPFSRIAIRRRSLASACGVIGVPWLPNQRCRHKILSEPDISGVQNLDNLLLSSSTWSATWKNLGQAAKRSVHGVAGLHGVPRPGRFWVEGERSIT